MKIGLMAGLLVGLALLGLFSIWIVTHNADEDYSEDTLPKVVLAEMKSPISGPLTIAHLNGYYKEEGLDLEVKSFSIARLAVDAMIGHSADFGMAADIVTMNIFTSNQEIYSIGTYSHDKSNKILARKDRGIKTIPDLRGKKIGIFKGTALEAYLFKVLEHEKISFNEVTLVNLQVSDMPAALLRGDIDAFSSIEPFITLTKEKMGENGIILQNKEAYEVTPHILVRKEIIEERPAYIQKFLRAIKKADRFIQENPSEAKQLLADYTGLSIEAMDIYFNDVQFNLEANLSRSLFELEEEYEVGKQIGIISDSTIKPDFTDFLYFYLSDT